MRTRTAWSGRFHCQYCQIEELLDSETTLGCRECGELMAPGPLLDGAELSGEEVPVRVGSDENVGS